jgi:hypothetical protein
MDWADEIAKQIGASDGRSFHNETITKFAAALRKAKADGYRKAAKDLIDGFSYAQLSHTIIQRANAIEKGTE